MENQKHQRQNKIRKEFYYGAMVLIGHPCTPKELVTFTKTNMTPVHRCLKELVNDGVVGRQMSPEDGRTTLYYRKGGK